MQLTVQGKQMDVGDALRTHVTDKLEDINQKYFNHATDATVTFSKEGHGHSQIKAHIHIRVGKSIRVMADAVEPDPYVAFDMAAEKVAKQLRRYKTRLRDHHARAEQIDKELETITAKGYVLASEPESAEEQEDDVPYGDDPAIIAEMTTDIETLSVYDAVMRMDLADQPALLFKNAKHKQINMVYRRPDGNVGWIDPVANNVEKEVESQSA